MSRHGLTKGGPWWRHAVTYQVYVRSFADSDGDGMGDLRGVRSRLPYIALLGVDAVWLNPFYPSPQADAGYDVSDYRNVDPLFGSMDDADALIADAHALGLRVVVDLVPNHTSSEHPWFRAALASPPGSRERARYLFRDGSGPGGSEPPNGWVSNFGGSAWTRLPDGQWYLHLFAPEQPDLDWTNREILDEFDAILRFWLDRGVDGFRIDVAHGLAKDPALPDLPRGIDPRAPESFTGRRHPHWDRDEVHDVYRRWRRILDAYPGDRASVAEAWVHDLQRLARYVRPGELHTAFNFRFLTAPWDAGRLRAVIDETLATLAAVGAPATWVLSNHDVTRVVTRYGGGAAGLRRARAAALLMLALPGSAYVYQGEELGLEEVGGIPAALRQDPTFLRSGGAKPGRDGCRVPIPWAGTEAPFGFGPSGDAWLPQPEAWAALTVEAQERDPGSTLSLYRAAIAARRALSTIADRDLEWLASDADMLAFRRRPRFACAVNLGAAPGAVPAGLDGGRVILSSRPVRPGSPLPGETAAWYALP